MAANNIIQRRLRRQREKIRRERVFLKRFNPLEVLEEDGVFIRFPKTNINEVKSRICHSCRYVNYSDSTNTKTRLKASLLKYKH